MRFFAFAMIFALGCAPEKKSPHTYTVAPDALVRSYRDSPLGDRAYTGHRVRLTLSPGSYEVSGDQVFWFIAPKTAPAIVFNDCKLPSDNSKAIVIIGLCEGITRDEKHRTYGVDYYVTIRCSTLAVASGPLVPRSD